MTPTKEPRPEAPVYGSGGLDYETYLRVPELLRLQSPRSKPAHHDELLFIIIHQAYELWFKLLIHELDTLIRYLRAGNIARSRHFASRVVDVFKLLIRQIHLLETMQPIEFLGFRDHLKPASGFQSVQFRELEFLLGIKDPAYLRFFEATPALKKRLAGRLRSTDVGEAFLAALKKRGVAVDPHDAQASRRDADVARRVARGLVGIYENPEADFTLYQLCEKLLEIDENFHLWRQHHVTVVERIIGSKMGTGGSSGVTYLRTTTTKRCFPYLWDVRTLLGEPAAKE